MDLQERRLTLAPQLTATTAAQRGAPSAAGTQAIGSIEVELAQNRMESRMLEMFDILERDLSQADGELTPTLKVKRALVYRAYADRFARLYDG